ncbi:adenine-specific DNA-methyltransferase [Nonlabens sp. Hel1_33_55]|uniref:site-specific DNA-methyltransferase n=1 Tax=Nonlabens sp. Hel1_33_55 TaxID=1336802 RepID=UPI000875C898|nr:site-specific DNA-methyltransferase [Nonlabens sp. Hel1_33_55]SCY36661.1 adenine-specific DNA-methyltransferase [Nonlabens sp. Hel1_33_55]
MPTLNWIGKEKVVNHHQDVPFRTLEKQYTYIDGKESKDGSSENKIIHGDNLEALKSLLPEYEGKVDCIYIDPPYNTGNENWVYNDNVSHPRLKKWLGEVVGKEGEDLSRHDKWLCMMYPRLKLLHKLLSSNGAIFISIDDTAHSFLKLICDEIFGANNFLNDIIWQHSIQPKGYTGKFSVHHNHTLVYQRSNSFELGLFERTDEDNKSYSNSDNDSKGMWRTGDVRNALYRPNLIYDLQTPSGKVIKPPEKGWRWSKSTMASKIKTGEIFFNEEETSITRKIYLKDQSGRPPETIWFANKFGSTRKANKTLKEIFGKSPFDTPKPFQFIEGILNIATRNDSIILDSFAGSGTTAHAVLNLNKEDDGNRKFILVEMEDYAQDITAERVKRVIDGYGSGTKKTEGTGGDFSYYELGDPLFNEDNLLNENVAEEKILEYVWYSETKTPYQPTTEKFSLGKKEEVAYYFFYIKKAITTLDMDFLRKIQTKADQYIIYADNCLLDKKMMDKYHIIFKKIPRDISRF